MEIELPKPIKRKPHTCEITERDYCLLRFLWRWKAVSTMALARKFFPKLLPRSAYRRLIYLENDFYIQSVVVEDQQHVWVLGPKGYKHIMERLGDLKQGGHKSEYPRHDYLATAFHLGEWLTMQPDNTENYSEQQLRRLPPDVWAQWVPRSETHRPDGYSVYLEGDKKIVVAFETELWSKARDRYESVAAFYDCEENIQLVFWLVDSKVTMKAVRNALTKFSRQTIDKHHFVLLKDFKAKGWMARFIEGRFKGKCPRDFLMHSCITPASPTHHRSDVFYLLNTRKKPINPRVCEIAKTEKKSD